MILLTKLCSFAVTLSVADLTAMLTIVNRQPASEWRITTRKWWEVYRLDVVNCKKLEQVSFRQYRCRPARPRCDGRAGCDEPGLSYRWNFTRSASVARLVPEIQGRNSLCWLTMQVVPEKGGFSSISMGEDSTFPARTGNFSAAAPILTRIPGGCPGDLDGDGSIEGTSQSSITGVYTGRGGRNGAWKRRSSNEQQEAGGSRARTENSQRGSGGGRDGRKRRKETGKKAGDCGTDCGERKPSRARG